MPTGSPSPAHAPYLWRRTPSPWDTEARYPQACPSVGRIGATSTAMYRHTISAALAAVLWTGCAGGEQATDAAPPPSEVAGSPETSFLPPGLSPVPLAAVPTRPSALAGSVVGLPAATAFPVATPIPPSPTDFHFDDVVVTPRVVATPSSDADALMIASYIAEVWANSGPEFEPWNVAANAFLTDAFTLELASDPNPGATGATWATAIAAERESSATGEHITVTIEQVSSGDESAGWRLLVVELLLVEVDGTWLVASLEVVG